MTNSPKQTHMTHSHKTYKTQHYSLCNTMFNALVKFY